MPDSERQLMMHRMGSGCSCVTLQDGDDDAPGDQVWWFND